MKKFSLSRHFFATVILFAGIAGCKKSEDTPASIVGEWEARSETIKLSNTSTNPPTVISNGTESYAPGHGAYASLKADNSYVYKDSAGAATSSESGTYVFSNGRLITTASGGSSNDTSYIALNGDSFVLSQTEQQGSLLAEFTFTFFHP